MQEGGNLRSGDESEQSKDELDKRGSDQKLEA